MSKSLYMHKDTSCWDAEGQNSAKIMELKVQSDQSKIETE